MKKYNFDEIIERRGTSCVKHDMMDRLYGTNDLIPMWVADMDFRSPDFVMEAIRQRCTHEVLAYTFGSDSYFDAITDWLKRHYAVSANKTELHFVPGIVAAIAFAIQAFTEKGDGIMTMTPVYPPFVDLPSYAQRRLVCSPLKTVDGRFAIDFEDFEKKVSGCKLLLLSNPHNPGGTVWDANDLQRIDTICRQSGTIVVSDEIHADLTLPGHHHTSFTTVSAGARANTITFIAPSKTFNIAGMGSSVAYIPDEKLRAQYFGYLDGYEVANGNVFAYTAAEAAYRHGDEWLAQAREYIAGNVAFTMDFLNSHLPAVVAMPPEASFLVWLDFRPTGLDYEDIKSRLLNRAKVALNDGVAFGGTQYKGFFRINIGCPRAKLHEALQRIATAMQ
ncbi:MAG: pyridoxal phosphate-dependent aminotransferase [Bacteroidales bacterium]|nr:pyridoxal phosphate-dependent aminotransferase [Bacteroidales bacterium]